MGPKLTDSGAELWFRARLPRSGPFRGPFVSSVRPFVALRGLKLLSAWLGTGIGSALVRSIYGQSLTQTATLPFRLGRILPKYLIWELNFGEILPQIPKISQVLGTRSGKILYTFPSTSTDLEKLCHPSSREQWLVCLVF